MKERITITLDEHLLRSIDARVEANEQKNRSQVIENILREHCRPDNPKIACILAGGRGKRLKPITEEIQKCMLPLQGRPILEHIIAFFKKQGIKHIILFVGFKKETILRHFGDGSNFGVHITYIEEASPLGTAGPLHCAQHMLTETFVVSNGDELKDIDIQDMYQFHKKTGAPATIALTQVEDTKEYGAVRLRGNTVVSFMEKARASLQTNLISAGLYLFEPSIFSYIKEGKSSLEKDVFPALVQQEKLMGYPFDGQWFDTGSFEQYEEAIKKWKG